MTEIVDLTESEYRQKLRECFNNARVGPYILTEHTGKPALLKFPDLISDLEGTRLKVWEDQHHMIDSLDKIYSGASEFKELYNQMYQDSIDGIEIMSHPGREMIKGDFIMKVYDNEEQLLREMNLSRLPTKLVPQGAPTKARAPTKVNWIRRQRVLRRLLRRYREDNKNNKHM